CARRPRVEHGEKADGNREALRLLEVLAQPRAVLRPLVLRRVEGVPLKLSRRAEVFKGVDAHHIDPLGSLRLTGERERMEEQRAVPWLPAAGRPAWGRRG